MTPLDTHNRELTAEHHARLGWRADCPICRRTRLAGPVPDTQLVPRRAKAALAAAIAAGGALPTAPASAQAPVPAAPSELVPPEGAGSHPAEGSTGPVGGAPVPPAAAPAVEAGGVLPEPGANTEPTQGREHIPPAPPAPSTPSAPAPAEGQAPGPPEAPRQPAEHSVGGRGRSSDRSTAPPAGRNDEAATPAQRSPSAIWPRPETSRETATRVPPNRRSRAPRRSGTGASEGYRSGATDTPNRERRGRRATDDISEKTYVVRPGDSLWLIAARALDARASDAAIAAAVNRLWERNADRIATGDPDLIYPGQRLVVEVATPE